MEPGFVKACSNNLPVVDAVMVGNFLSSNPDYVGCEQRGVKLSRSSRESYGDSAIGYVQLKRDGVKCNVRGRVTPEHRIRVKPYSVNVVINEADEIIESASCMSCAASKGGCKHTVAFLMWLHRRSEEPSPTEVENYWKRSKLSGLGSDSKPLKVKDLAGAIPLERLEDGTFREEVSKALRDSGEFGSGLMSLTHFLDVKSLALHQMLLTYKEMTNGEVSAPDFLQYASKYMEGAGLCEVAFKSTVEQHASPLWHQLRLGRISASRAHEVIHCQKRDGVLVEMIVGGRKIKDSDAMRRGRDLEGEVLKELGRKLKKKVERCGLALHPEYPFMGASPDGVVGESLVEVKCPQKDSTFIHYVKNMEPTPKYITQMMVQMLLMGKFSCLFVVADPEFESNAKIFIHNVKFNNDLANDIAEKCKTFWCDTIFKMLS